MANYELSNIAYKGNNYTIKDNTALHQNAVGSWMPDFANLKALATYEYDISSTSYFKICERPNVTTITDIADEVLAFRITVTGTNIFAIADVVMRAQPTVNSTPKVTINYQTMSITAATTGIRYFRVVQPKAANTSYNYELAIAAYNTTKRHIKVEVFKAPSAWIFSSAATAYSYNSTYQTVTDLTLYTRIGLIGSSTHYINTAYSDYAGYTSSWMGLFNSTNSVLVAGAAIAANQFAFVGEDYKVYPVTNTTQPILTAWPIVFVTTAIASGAACTWSYLRTWGWGTPATSILRDTLAAHETVYLKCTYMNGKVYSQNRITPTIGVGSNSTDTYYRLGVMYNTTALAFNTMGGVYFTVDMDGNMRAINGYSINAENANVANAVKRQFNIVGANDYPILFDSNPSSNITTATTIPSLTPALKYNPSTGNLSSTLFTGSGAGLTDIPLSGIQGGDELLPTKTLNVYHDLDQDTYAFTDSLTTQEIKDILNDALGGAINLQISISDVDTTRLLKYYQNGNIFIAKYLVFEDTPTIDMTTYQNHSLQSYFGIVWSDGSDNFQFASIPGDNLADLSQQFMLMLDGKENLSNKVTSVDSSSTDDQYPSAKAVYDNMPAVYYGTCSSGQYQGIKVIDGVPANAKIQDGTILHVNFSVLSTLAVSASVDLSINDTRYPVRTYMNYAAGYGTVSSYAGAALNQREDVDFVFKTISDVLYAVALDVKADALKSIWSANNRNTNLNEMSYPINGLMYTIAASAVTAANGKPNINGEVRDSYVLAMNWDNSRAYGAQLAIANGNSAAQGGIAYRRQKGATNISASGWYDWKTVLDEDNVSKYVGEKTTTVDSTSTDDQYPSAKAVYDIVPSKVDYSNTPFVGTCSTAAGTLAKTVTVDSSFQLVDGVRVRVYMEHANTNSAPTLNVNSTGAKQIGIQNPYGTVSNVALSAWHAGAFCRNGWFDFFYAASYNSGAGRWIIEDAPAPIRLANFAASRLSSINSTNGTLVNGGVRYTVVANGATGNPFGGSAAVLWLHHDSGVYCRQIAMSANTPPHMAFRSQKSDGGTGWQDWEYVLTAANQYDSHMATLAYTASAIDFTTGAVTIPINGTQYKLIQLTLFNNDISKALGYPSLFLFNASGSTGYKEGTSYYCSATSTSSNISVTFDSSFGLIGSTSIDITALYRRIS